MRGGLPPPKHQGRGGRGGRGGDKLPNLSESTNVRIYKWIVTLATPAPHVEAKVPPDT